LPAEAKASRLKLLISDIDEDTDSLVPSPLSWRSPVPLSSLSVTISDDFDPLEPGFTQLPPTYVSVSSGSPVQLRYAFRPANCSVVWTFGESTLPVDVHIHTYRSERLDAESETVLQVQVARAGIHAGIYCCEISNDHGFECARVQLSVADPGWGGNGSLDWEEETIDVSVDTSAKEVPQEAAKLSFDVDADSKEAPDELDFSVDADIQAEEPEVEEEPMAPVKQPEVEKPRTDFDASVDTEARAAPKESAKFTADVDASTTEATEADFEISGSGEVEEQPLAHEQVTLAEAEPEEAAADFSAELEPEQSTESATAQLSQAVAKPAPVILQGLQPQTVIEGQTVEFHVGFEAHEEQAVVTWLKDGVKLAPSERISIETRPKSTSLRIQEATKEDIAEYSVSLSVDEDTEPVVSEARLTVEKKDKPAKFTDQLVSKTVKLNEKVILEVNYEGYPQPDVVWTFDGKVDCQTDERFTVTVDNNEQHEDAYVTYLSIEKATE
uniref:Ig-like domain-containing protein n=1 Tax=Macrostomum lignano TaxID=282301 RepID=A0A1I8GNF4_9PLAT